MTRTQQLCFRYLELARQDVEDFNAQRLIHHLKCALDAATDLPHDAREHAPEHAAIEEA